MNGENLDQIIVCSSTQKTKHNRVETVNDKAYLHRVEIYGYS